MQAAPSTNESLSAAALAAAPPEKQKNMIGERLYPLIYEGQPALAGKITGAFWWWMEMFYFVFLERFTIPSVSKGKSMKAEKLPFRKSVR